MGEGLPEGRASCGHDAAWRCLDCSGSPSFCMRCCAETHRNSPLHRVQFWNGQYFQQAWLRQVGVQVHCGHEGSRCPELPPTMPTYGNDRMLVVVDITGIHELPFTFCRCRSAAPEDLQLLALGYYPASQTRPRTVFTLRVLDAFLLANRETNASPRSFYN
ncbi:hypothetical protein L227DRAFT_509623, partial [Lentinus tigrinus ALCF2SS1-6]